MSQNPPRHIGLTAQGAPADATATKTPPAGREAAPLAGQQPVEQRRKIADRRRTRADPGERPAPAGSTLDAISQGQLREANERLVIATVRAQAMTEAAEESAERMAYMAEHDFLTGLPNRSLLTARLAQSMALAQRHGKRVALLYLDLDHFKHINDSLGHAVGDQLLQAAAKRLQVCLRISDTLCRQGGDEFVVLLAEIESPHDAELAAEKLIQTMTDPFLLGEHRLHVTLSIGISVYPDDGTDAETVVRNADIAMYHAKRNGRNSYQTFTAQMNTRAIARQSVQQALHQALERQLFVLHYQPKVNLETGAITGAEALIRMQGSPHTLISPSKFVSIAEDCGLILPVGKWVLHEACRQTRRWLQDGLRMGQIAINISAVQLRSKDFLVDLKAMLKDTGLDPHFIEIELTESGLMQDTEATTHVLHALKKIGVQLAIDDFGTGYSSLSYLQHFPIDTIKIDQSFIHDIVENKDETAIVSAILAMGRSLNLRVVAEGIETPQQLAFLRSLHCAEGQGYYFGRPMPAEQFAHLLKSAQAI